MPSRFSLRPSELGRSIVPDGGGFVSQKVTKGRITNARTRYFREFMFNPSEVETTDGWAWGEQGIPGASHKLLSGGAGEARSLNLTLYLDGDRGRREQRIQGQVGNQAELTFDVRQSLDISEDLKFYKSLTFASNALRATGLLERVPVSVIFTMGPMWQGVEMKVRTVTERIVMFTPTMAPMRATVTLNLLEVMQRPRTAYDIFKDPFEDSRDTDF